MLETPTTVDAEPKTLAVMVSMTAQIADKRSIVMQTYLPQDAALDAYHGVIDKLTAAIDRQETMLDVVALAETLEHHEATLKQLESDFKAIEPMAQERFERDPRRAGRTFKLSENEIAQKNTAEQNIKRFRTEIAKVRQQLAAAKAKVET
jgi:hypothetical protein